MTAVWDPYTVYCQQTEFISTIEHVVTTSQQKKAKVQATVGLQ